MAAIEVDKDQDPREALLKYAKVGRTFVLAALTCIGGLEGCLDYFVSVYEFVSTSSRVSEISFHHKTLPG